MDIQHMNYYLLEGDIYDFFSNIKNPRWYSGVR